jgi:hypothetical protein
MGRLQVGASLDLEFVMGKEMPLRYVAEFCAQAGIGSAVAKQSEGRRRLNQPPGRRPLMLNPINLRRRSYHSASFDLRVDAMRPGKQPSITRTGNFEGHTLRWREDWPTFPFSIPRCSRWTAATKAIFNQIFTQTLPLMNIGADLPGMNR